MRSETRSGLATVLWLTIYVGLAPFAIVTVAMFGMRSQLELEDWGGVFAVAYVALLMLGARAYAKHFERPIG
jgi:hypothetical protein